LQEATTGGYTLVEAENAKLIIAATGSEVALAVDAATELSAKGVPTSVVSLPDFFTFDSQSYEYKKSVFPDGVPVLSVEVMTSFGWGKYAHAHVSLDHFGASAPANKLFEKFGFTKDNVVAKASKVVEYYSDKKAYSKIDSPF